MFEENILNYDYIELAEVLYDGQFDSLGVMTPEEALDIINNNPTQEYVWRGLGD